MTTQVKCTICGQPVTVEVEDHAEAQEIRDAQRHGECQYYCAECQPSANQEWTA